MLQVIVSPAKQMRAAQDAFEVQGIPPFARETAQLHHALLDIERTEGDSGLQALWNVSNKLLGPCLDILHEFEPILGNGDLADSGIARRISPAIMSYHGIQYQSMAPEVMDAEQLAWLQSHLWILSGLYGCVRPFHAVEPYRLEMGAKLAVDDARDLYAFWGDKLARATAPAGSNTTIVNLASVEYAKAVLPHLARLHGAVDGRKQARGCKRTYRIQHRLSAHPRALIPRHPRVHQRTDALEPAPNTDPLSLLYITCGGIIPI